MKLLLHNSLHNPNCEITHFVIFKSFLQIDVAKSFAKNYYD